jgi:hypothetical protein
VLLCHKARQRHHLSQHWCNHLQSQVTRRTKGGQRFQANRCPCLHHPNSNPPSHRTRRDMTHLPNQYHNHLHLSLALLLPAMSQTLRNVCATVETRRRQLPPSSVRLNLLEKLRIHQNRHLKKVGPLHGMLRRRLSTRA